MSSLTRLLSPTDTPVLSPALRETLAHWHTLPLPDLTRAHERTRYVVLNTHASGLDPDHDRLISVAAIAVNACRIQLSESYHAELGPHPEAVMADVLTFAGSGPVVVYNAGFNRRLLERAFKQHLGLTPAWLWLDLYRLLPAVFEQHCRTPTRLARWMEILEISTFQRFDALGDAYALAKLLLALQAHAARQGSNTAAALADLQRSLPED